MASSSSSSSFSPRLLLGLFLSCLLLLHASLASPANREVRAKRASQRRSWYDPGQLYYDYGDNQDVDTYDFDVGQDLGFLPGEVDSFRNVLIDLMDILDDGTEDQQKIIPDYEEEEEEEEEEEPAVVIIVVEDENYDPSDVTLASLLYDEDASWGPCTRSCAARRHRKCVYPTLCGEEEMLEKALCYVPGSSCEIEVKEFLEQEGYTIVENNEDEVLEDDLEADPDFDITDYIDVDLAEIEGDYGSDGEEYGTDGAEYYDYGWYDYLHSLTGDEEPPVQEEDYDYEQEAQQSQEEGGHEQQEETGVPADTGCGRKMVRGPESLLRIIGGREASRGAWPWQVAVLNRFKEVFCGGTLISSQWVLTAAHCIRKRLYVRLAEHDIRAYDHQEVEMRVESYFAHPDYDEEITDSDIALLKLPRHAAFTRYILPACLPGRGTPPPAKSKCVVAGWGKERETHIFGSDVLNYARVPIVTKSACRRAYPDHPITDNHLCAGNKRGTSDTCAGDSGGPLMCEDEQGRWTVHGVTSFGEGCGDQGKYGVYTKVVNYLPWIKKIIKEN